MSRAPPSCGQRNLSPMATIESCGCPELGEASRVLNTQIFSLRACTSILIYAEKTIVTIKKRITPIVNKFITHLNITTSVKSVRSWQYYIQRELDLPQMQPPKNHTNKAMIISHTETEDVPTKELAYARSFPRTQPPPFSPTLSPTIVEVVQPIDSHGHSEPHVQKQKTC